MLKDYSKQPIIITGCARSGTSMIAGIINLCGAWKGVTSGPNKNNAKGMFENTELRQNVMKPYLRNLGVDPLGQYPLPRTKDIKIPFDFDEKVIQIVKNQGWSPELRWMYKGAKICLVWPVWHFHFPDAKWIIVRRKSADIVDSCLRTSFMRAFVNKSNQMRVNAKNEKEAWLWWVRQHERKFVEIIEAGANVKIVWAERMVDSNYSQMKETIEWLGLEWNEKAIVDFVDPKLWKARRFKDGTN